MAGHLAGIAGPEHRKMLLVPWHQRHVQHGPEPMCPWLTKTVVNACASNPSGGGWTMVV
jgi:hypothetical protein